MANNVLEANEIPQEEADTITNNEPWQLKILGRGQACF
jgi:hypothetical protein